MTMSWSTEPLTELTISWSVLPLGQWPASLSVHSKNLNVAIFLDTINVKLFMMVALTELSVTLKITAVSNSFNWKFYVLTGLSWNVVLFLITSSGSLIYHFFCFVLHIVYSREIMTFTLIQDHRCVRNMNYLLCVLYSCPLQFKQNLYGCYIYERIMHNMIWVTLVCIQRRWFRCFSSVKFWLVKNFNIRVYSDTIM